MRCRDVSFFIWGMAAGVWLIYIILKLGGM